MNYTDTDIDVIHQVQYATLKDVRDFCVKNDIRYFLYCGTLLGCIRHGGFIPWDDDVDLAMPLEDYKKFSKLAPKDKQFTAKYAILGSYYDRAPEYPWTKVSRKNTVYYDRRFLDNKADKGISLDIYPLIGVYDDKKKADIQDRALRLQKALFLLEHNKDTDYIYVKDQSIVPQLRKYAKIPACLRAFLVNRISHWFWPDPFKCKRVGTIDALDFAGKFDSQIWEKSDESDFEDEYFTIPDEFNTVLTTMYGDYIHLPPEEERVLSHMHETCMYIGPDVAEKLGIEL